MEIYRSMPNRIADVTSAYIRQVYLWMTFGLAITGLVAWYVANNPVLRSYVLHNTIIFIVLIVLQLALVIALSAAIQRMSGGVASAAFLLYSVLSGATLSSIFIVYTNASIANAFFVTAATFLVMSIYGTVTKRDLTGWGSFLMMGLIGIIIAMVINIFWKNNVLNFVISCIGVLIFTGLTAYDTQKLRKYGATLDPDDGTSMRRGVILGALTLYLDFINLFLMFLRFFGGRRD